MNLFIKKFLVISSLMIFCVAGFSQSKPAYEMTVNGIKVIVQPSANEIVQVLTIFKGGVQNYPADKAGIEDLALTALLECGTKNDSKNSFKNKLDKVSAEISETTGLDYSTVNLNCINSDLSQVWPLYVDAISRPLFDSTEFERMRIDNISAVNNENSTPDASIRKMAMETAFKGKDYSKSQWGDEQTLRKITLAETRDYYSWLLARSRMVIVVVAELEKTAIEKMVKELTDNIPEGKSVKPGRYEYVPAKNTFADQNKALATNYIMGITSGPLPGANDYNPFAIAMRIYSMKNFVEIRTNNGLSYAPSARYQSGLSPYTLISVTTKYPDKFIAVNNNLLERTHAEGFSAEDVKNAKTGFVTSYYSTMETNAAQANSLAANEVLFNDWRRSIRINEDMKKVTAEEVTKSFNKYVRDFTWVYQGDTSKVNPSLYTAMPGTQKLPETKLSGNKN